MSIKTKKRRRLVEIIDTKEFDRNKDIITALGDRLGRREKITDTRALRIMIATASSFYGKGDHMMVVDYAACREHMARTGEAHAASLADEIIGAHCQAMGEFMGLKITVKREGQTLLL